MLKKIIAAASLAAMAASSYAATPGSVYAGVDAGSTKLDSFSDRESSLGAFVGYNVNQNFAIEGGYRRLASMDEGVLRNFDGKIDQTSLSAIGTLPLSNGFSVFGRLGYNRVVEKVSGDGFSFKFSDNKALYGVGVGYAFDDKLSGRIELQKPSSDSHNISAGVSYAF